MLGGYNLCNIMILLKNLQSGKIYKDRLTDDKVLVSSVDVKQVKIPGGKRVGKVDLVVTRYNPITGELDYNYYPSDYQLEEL